ncbi:MAG: hypothetical protein DRI46_13245, partial [Chloroflexi bacterium]
MYEEPIIEGEYEEAPVETISDDELVQICMDEASNALHGESDESISLPLDYYYGRKPLLKHCKDPSASTLVSMDVHDAIESTVAEVMPAFGGGHIADFEAETEEDEEQAKVESDVCNYLLMEKYNGLEVLTTGLKDCLLHRNGYAKVYWDRKYVVTFDSYQQVPQEQIQQIMQPRSEGEEVEIASHEEVAPPEEVQAQHEQMMAQAGEQGQEPPQMPGFFDITLKRTIVKSQPVIESTPPEESLVDETLQCVDLTRARFTCHRNIVSKSELIAHGYDRALVENLSEYSGASISNYSRHRNDYNGFSPHDSTKNVEVYECYVRVDRDGDGIAELRRVVISNNQLLDDVEWDETDMIAGATCIMPHQHQGVSMYDMQKDIQDAKTDLLRSV